jgi:hypothetical protein
VDGQRRDDALDHRPVDDREHLLGRVGGERAEAGTEPADEDDRPHGFAVVDELAVVVAVVVELAPEVLVEPGADVEVAEVELVEPVGAVTDGLVTGSVVVVLSLAIWGVGEGWLWSRAAKMTRPPTRSSAMSPAGHSQRLRLGRLGSAARAARATFFACDALPMEPRIYPRAAGLPDRSSSNSAS